MTGFAITSPRRASALPVHYPVPIHRVGAYADLGLATGSLPVAERLADRICTLPLFPGMSQDETAHVIQAVQGFLQEASVRLNVSGDSERFVRKRFGDELEGVRPLNVAVVGYGYCGPHLVRNIMASPSLELAALCGALRAVQAGAAGAQARARRGHAPAALRLACVVHRCFASRACVGTAPRLVDLRDDKAVIDRRDHNALAVDGFDESDGTLSGHRLSWWPLVTIFALFCFLGVALTSWVEPSHSWFNWYLAALWSMYAPIAFIGVLGARHLHQRGGGRIPSSRYTGTTDRTRVSGFLGRDGGRVMAGVGGAGRSGLGG